MKKERIKRAYQYVEKFELRLKLVELINDNIGKGELLPADILREMGEEVASIPEFSFVYEKLHSPIMDVFTKREKIIYRISKARIDRAEGRSYETTLDISEDKHFGMEHQSILNICTKLNVSDENALSTVAGNKLGKNRVVCKKIELKAIQHFIKDKHCFWTRFDVESFLDISTRTVTTCLKRWGIKPIRTIKKDSKFRALTGSKLSYSEIHSNAKKENKGVLFLRCYGLTISLETRRNTQSDELLNPYRRRRKFDDDEIKTNIMTIYSVSTKTSYHMSMDEFDIELINELFEKIKAISCSQFEIVIRGCDKNYDISKLKILKKVSNISEVYVEDNWCDLV